MANGLENGCCGRTMAEGYRCEGCPYATKAHTLVPRIPEDPNPTPEREVTDTVEESVTPQRLIAWLDAKFARHGEEEDKWAADYIRATLAQPGILTQLCAACGGAGLIPQSDQDK